MYTIWTYGMLAPVEFGENFAKSCNIQTKINSTVQAILTSSCQPGSAEDFERNRPDSRTDRDASSLEVRHASDRH